MSSEFDQMRAAWDKGVGDGRDTEGTLSLADDFVAANPNAFTGLRGLSLEQCVQAIDVLRDDPNNQFAKVLQAALGVDDWFVVQVWLWHKFEPQDIGGTAEPKVRIVNG